MIGGPRAAGDQGAGLLRWASLSLLVHGVLALASLDWTWSPMPASDWASAPSSPVEVRVVAPPQPAPPSPEDSDPTPQRKAPAPPEPKLTAEVEPTPAAPPDAEPDPASSSSAETPAEAANEAETAEVAALDSTDVSAPPPAPSGPSPEELDAYIAQVRRRIEERKSYPALARRRGLESQVTVRISIGADGELVRIETLGASLALFERATVEAIEDAAPFPPPPPGFGELEIPLRYTLD